MVMYEIRIKEVENLNQEYLYEVKSSLITDTEKVFFDAVKKVLPEGHFAQSQVNLAMLRVSDNYSFISHFFKERKNLLKYKPYNT